MKFALVNGQRQEARPTLEGKCPTCDQPMVAKCGETKVWHWAHKGRRNCDPWWENETEWHRAWKRQFPVNWQEIVCKAKTGEKHIADVKTDRGWVIEFQHSYLNPQERRSRDAFYLKLIWVVDGTRRKRDQAQFSAAYKCGVRVTADGKSKSHVRRFSLNDCTLLKEWMASNAPVFFDFGEKQWLWWLLGRSNGANRTESAYVVSYPRAKFIHSHRDTATELAQKFDKLVEDIPKLIEKYDLRLRKYDLCHQMRFPKRLPTQPLSGFQRYLAKKDRRRERF